MKNMERYPETPLPKWYTEYQEHFDSELCSKYRCNQK